jgi:hypothetical protein
VILNPANFCCPKELFFSSDLKDKKNKDYEKFHLKLLPASFTGMNQIFALGSIICYLC